MTAAAGSPPWLAIQVIETFISFLFAFLDARSPPWLAIQVIETPL